MKDLRKKAEEILERHESASKHRDYLTDFKAAELDLKESRLDAMLEMYSLDRPKSIPFDANDPMTFPKKDKSYFTKRKNGWHVDIWFKNRKEWYLNPGATVTHYAENLMPE